MAKAVFCETNLMAENAKYKTIHIMHLDCTKSWREQTEHGAFNEYNHKKQEK